MVAWKQREGIKYENSGIFGGNKYSIAIGSIHF
jgi:hypothetical protein